MHTIEDMIPLEGRGEGSRLTINDLSLQTISGFSDDRLAAGVREIKRRQRKLSLTLYRMPRFSTAQAATRIQVWKWDD